MSNPPLIVKTLLAAIVVVAAVWDFRARRIPNWVSLSGVVLGIALNSFLYEAAGLRMSIEGILLAFAIYFPLYLIRGMGAGDVKLMAAVGAIMGWQNWLGILVLTSLFGAAIALALVTWQGVLARTLYNIVLILKSLALRQAPYQNHPQLDVRSQQGVRLPHAVSIAFGSIAFLVAAAVWAPK